MKPLRTFETILRGVLYVSPIAANTENENFLQLSQSLLDTLDVIKVRGEAAMAGDLRVKAQLACKVIETLQLAIEMLANEPERAVIKIELLKFALRLLTWKKGQRLGEKSGPVSNELLLSDFLKCLAPVVYVIAKNRMTPGGALSVYLTLQVVSLTLIEDGDEFKKRLRVLALDLISKPPVYQLTVRKPIAFVSDIWQRIPVLRELNYLSYLISLGDRFYYYAEGSRGPLP